MSTPIPYASFCVQTYCLYFCIYVSVCFHTCSLYFFRCPNLLIFFICSCLFLISCIYIYYIFPYIFCISPNIQAYSLYSPISTWIFHISPHISIHIPDLSERRGFQESPQDCQAWIEDCSQDFPGIFNLQSSIRYI